MHGQLITLGLSFIEGIALIASPCILPILPIILAGSLSGSRQRPFGIICGFVLTFSIFTYFSRQLVQYSGIDLNLIRHVSYVILIFLGIIMLSSYLTDKFNQFTQRLLHIGSSHSFVNNTEGDFFSGLLYGGLVAIIWTPCAGPILAAVIVQTAIQQTNWVSFLILLAFAIGVALPLFFIALYGRVVIDKFSFVKKRTDTLRKGLGMIIILSVIYLMMSEIGLVQIETKESGVRTSSRLEDAVSPAYPAPEIAGIATWINSKPLQIQDLKGKVVLIDFWTYSCINCIRTLPYIKGWYQTYRDKGLVVIGIHTPEFEFEKNSNNVRNGVEKFGIQYPVALDNNFVTWRHFNNEYWPAHYLIDQKGNVVYTHFGEGEYNVTENNIRYLLGLDKTTSIQNENHNEADGEQTPETYLGYSRAENFMSHERVARNKEQAYTLQKPLNINDWGLDGIWKIMPDKVIAIGKSSSITIHFNAKHVYAVMGSTTPLKLTVLFNSKNPGHFQGKDVTNGVVQVDRLRLYDLLELDKANDGTLTLIGTTPGLEMYTFTFGN